METLLETSLRDEFEILLAKSNADAVLLLQQNSDIMILLASSRKKDTKLQGLEFLTMCSNQYPLLGRILITENGDDSLLRKAINQARIQFVTSTPVEMNLLTPAIRELAGDSMAARSQQRLARSFSMNSGNRDGSLANKDRLTGLYNHRSFQERIREEVSRARRYNQSLSVIYADLDNFSSLNRGAGFRCGDLVLQKVSSIFRSQEDETRNSDIACRFGGQQFVALLPETDKMGAATKAERLRESTAIAVMPGGVSVTLSIGVATFPEDGASASDLLYGAKGAMQAAKELGRNRVFLCGDKGENTTLPLTNIHANLFPTFHDRMGDLVYALDRDRMLSCLYVDLSRLRRIEQEFGIAQHNQLLARAGQLLSSMRGNKLRREDLLCKTDDADGFLCFLSPPREGNEEKIDFYKLGDRVAEVLETELTEFMRALTRDQPQVAVGISRVLENSMIRGERLVHRLVAESKQAASLNWQKSCVANKMELQDLIIGKRLRTAFQPLVDLDTGTRFAFEALTRGPINSPLAMPTTLFSVADAVNLTMELDRSCFERALENAKGCEPVHRLFLNLLPASFYDTHFIETQVVRRLDMAGLTPANLVFEITERLAIENFSAFRQAISRYTDMGFGIAVDDVGTRHSNLEAVMALQPHFIKLSEVLCRGVSTSTVKKEMVRSLVRIAKTIDAVTVAEGIEDIEELMILRDLGVRFGQGYVLARPDFCFPKVLQEAKDAILAKPQRKRSPSFKLHSPRTDSNKLDDRKSKLLAKLPNSKDTSDKNEITFIPSVDNDFEEDEPTRTRGHSNETVQ